MSPNNNEQVDLKLPAPEHADSQLSYRRETGGAVLNSGVPQAVGSNPAAAHQANLQTVNPTQPLSQAPTALNASQAAPNANDTKPLGSGLNAREADDIEEEWVGAAKRAIEHSGQDPRLLAESLHKLKAEYLQKRFGKTLKNESDQ